jgi:hypothetical protein
VGSNVARDIRIFDYTEQRVLTDAPSSRLPRVLVPVAEPSSASKSPPASKLVDGERPCDFGLNRPMRSLRRLCSEEGCVAPNPGSEHNGGDGYDRLVHNHSSGCCWPLRTGLIPGQELACRRKIRPRESAQ